MNTLINCISKDNKKSASITLKAMPKAYTKPNKNTIEKFLGRSDQYSVAIRWQWSFFKFRIPHSTAFLPQQGDVHKIQKYLNAWFSLVIFHSENTALPENIFFRLVDNQNMICRFKGLEPSLVIYATQYFAIAYTCK